MSSSKKKIKIERATEIANKVQDSLKPYCERINIAGSIRRQCELVGDIEILALPKTVEDAHLFFKGVIMPPQKPIYAFLDKLEARKRIRQIKKGKKFRQYILLDRKGNDIISVDLFLVFHPNEFGTQLLIRTGPQAFSKWMVNIKKNKGFKFENKRLYKKGQEFDTPTERGVFRILNIPYMKPEHRVGPVTLDEDDKNYYKNSGTLFCPECGSSSVKYNEQKKVTKCFSCEFEEIY